MPAIPKQLLIAQVATASDTGSVIGIAGILIQLNPLPLAFGLITLLFG